MDAAAFLRLLGSPGAGLSALADAPQTVGLSALAVDPMGDATGALEARRRQQVTDAGYPGAAADATNPFEGILSALGPTINERAVAAREAMRRGDMATANALNQSLALDFGQFLGNIKPVGGGTPYHLRPGVEPPTPNNPRGLPMDEASRMRRAKEMGFTQPAYHATYDDVPAFDFSRLGETTISNVEGLSIEPWAMNLARAGAWSAKVPVGAQTGAAAEMPLMLAGKRGPKTYQSLDDLEAAIRRAGGPEKYRDKMHAKGVGHVAVKDDEFGGTSFVSMAPEAIRSRFATFDPERAGSSDLLASIAPWLAALGGGAGLSALYLDGEEGGM